MFGGGLCHSTSLEMQCASCSTQTAATVSLMDSPNPPESLDRLVLASESALMEWLRLHVSRLMIEEIAENDYGRQSREYTTVIEAQIKPDAVSGIPWASREVLELERWSDPDRAYGDQLPTGRRGHLKRLLACTILLRSAAYLHSVSRRSEEEDFIATSAPTLIQLARSAIAVGDDAPQHALRFLLWIDGRQRHPKLRAFTAFCVLLLVVYSGRDTMCAMDFRSLSDWVLAVECHCRKQLDWQVASERWLLGLNSHVDCEGHREPWMAAAKAVLLQENLKGVTTGPVAPIDLDEILTTFVTLLCGDPTPDPRSSVGLF